MSASIPSDSDLRTESALLPSGWVVGWSRSNGRRFWARAPTHALPELKQWEPPTKEQIRQANDAAAAAAASSVTDSNSRKRAHSPDHSRHEPEFIAWKPASSSEIEVEQSLAAEAAAALAKKRRLDSEIQEARKEERQRELDQMNADDDDRNDPRKRRQGLGFHDSDSGRPIQPIGHVMKFVAPGGAQANTPANQAQTASSSSSTSLTNYIFHPQPGDPSRLESASLPRCTLNNPPIYPTSLETMLALTLAPASPPTKWSDPIRYAEVMRISRDIVLNTIYGTLEDSDTLIQQYLTSEQPLPLPPPGDEVEEEPRLINAVRIQTHWRGRLDVPRLLKPFAFPSPLSLFFSLSFPPSLQRRAAFNELDANLTRLCVEGGLREQPSMAFLRWGFNQRSLQQRRSLNQVDPLLPMDAIIDSCLLHELRREKMPLAKAEEICKQLAEKCKIKAIELVKLKKRFAIQAASAAEAAASETSSSSSSSSSTLKRFDLLLPHESHLHSFNDTHPSTNVGTHSSTTTTTTSFRERDLNASNQDPSAQYKLIYDWHGPSEYAIPLNHDRFTKLKLDYQRTTGPILEDIKEDQIFLRRLWTMLARYDTISGAGYQAALPEDGFEMLRQYWGVQHECYASPLNHHLESFGSAFWETDRWFGSKGSFLDQRPLEGGFEANPPFLEEVMAPMAMHVLALMERAQAKSQGNTRQQPQQQTRLFLETCQHILIQWFLCLSGASFFFLFSDSPLSFCVIWPGWDDTPSYDLLMCSRFMRHVISFEKFDHWSETHNTTHTHTQTNGVSLFFSHSLILPLSLPSLSFRVCCFRYKEGLQHRATKSVYRLSRARSFVFWVQTDAGAEKWPCTRERIELFKKAFMAKRN